MSSVSVDHARSRAAHYVLETVFSATGNNAYGCALWYAFGAADIARSSHVCQELSLTSPTEFANQYRALTEDMMRGDSAYVPSVQAYWQDVYQWEIDQ